MCFKPLIYDFIIVYSAQCDQIWRNVIGGCSRVPFVIDYLWIIFWHIFNAIGQIFFLVSCQIKKSSGHSDSAAASCPVTKKFETTNTMMMSYLSRMGPNRGPGPILRKKSLGRYTHANRIWNRLANWQCHQFIVRLVCNGLINF